MSDTTPAHMDTAERYRRLAAAMTDKVEQVRPDHWTNRTPCSDWDVRALVGHLVATQGMFAKMVGLELEPGPDVSDDPVGAWVAVRDQMQTLLDDPATANREFEGIFGPSTLVGAVDRFLCLDLNIHRWDLSRGLGVDDRIEPAEIERIRADLDVLGEMIRSRGTCGPAVEVPNEADEQDKLLGYLGRRP